MSSINDIPDSQPLAMMTAGDLRRLIESEWSMRMAMTKPEEPEREEQPSPKYLYGISEMAAYLHTNAKTFYRMRQKGVFDGVIQIIGKHARAKPEELDAAFEKFSRRY